MSKPGDVLSQKLKDLYPQHPTTTSLASAAHTSTVAFSQFRSWAAETLDKASTLIRPAPQPTSFNDKVLEFLTTYSTASVTTVAVALLSFIFLIYRYLMTDRGSFGYAGGRGSPFLGTWADPQRNLSGHFEYIDADEDIVPRHRPSTTAYDYNLSDDNDPNAPDRIHVRYLASQFSVDFPPYSVNEEKVSVKDLRKKVANALKANPANVRLLYKGKDLKKNSRSLKQYRMKQNSEVSAILSERARDYDGRGSPSDSGSDSASGKARAREPQPPPPPQRQRSHSSVRFRSDEQIPKLQTHGQANGNGFLSPTGHVPNTPTDRRGRERAESLRPSDASYRDTRRPHSRGPESRETGRTQERTDPRRERDPSRNRAPSPAPPPSQAPAADPNSPIGKIQALSSTFNTTWLPQATKFIMSPPPDADMRKKEHLKLTESIMQYIIDRADAIDIDGNVDARNKRKQLLNDANAVIAKLDAALKQSG